jgi:DNA-binding NarL/FixJ family response regulator
MKIEILVIGRHHQILQTLLRLINQNSEWEARGTSDDKEAMELFQQNNYDLVLLSSGIEEESECQLRLSFTTKNPSVIIIQHYGGGSGLLTGEILQALENKK